MACWLIETPCQQLSLQQNLLHSNNLYLEQQQLQLHLQILPNDGTQSSEFEAQNLDPSLPCIIHSKSSPSMM